jgi:hypothetical protein
MFFCLLGYERAKNTTSTPRFPMRLSHAQVTASEIRGSHGDEDVDLCLMGCEHPEDGEDMLIRNAGKHCKGTRHK